MIWMSHDACEAETAMTVGEQLALAFFFGALGLAILAAVVGVVYTVVRG